MLSVLVIEDEIHMQNAIKDTLSNYGYDVETAINGTIGIKQFDQRPFNLVILDIGLPDIDGFRVLEHIRGSIKRKTPVLGISGTPELLKKGDFNAVLVKPFRTTRLLELVMGLC